ncbi:hypothetical protein [Nonomuraea insulae]|uniref:Uncharacterized protein n=1 Tax=Nonomuraea insulae TaxID=1616787 RepID=A0ABW1D0B3_9ACTN
MRQISRLMVEGARPSSRAISRIDAFYRIRSAMWIRSVSFR